MCCGVWRRCTVFSWLVAESSMPTALSAAWGETVQSQSIHIGPVEHRAVTWINTPYGSLNFKWYRWNPSGSHNTSDFSVTIFVVYIASDFIWWKYSVRHKNTKDSTWAERRLGCWWKCWHEHIITVMVRNCDNLQG